MASTTVNFSLKNANDAAFADQTLTFKLLSTGADASGDYVVLPSSTTGTTAADGTGSVTLFTNGDSDIKSVYEVLFPSGERAEFIIPSGTTSISLADLLTGEQPSGSTAQQSSVYADAIKRSNHTGVQPLSSINSTDRNTIQLKPSEGAFEDGDKTKLDGIETSATADQTDEEIQDIVGGMLSGNTETGISATYDDTNGKINLVAASQTDENFTSADHTKLDGIEAGATADQTDEEIQDVVGGMLTGNTETGITVTYQDSDGTIDFSVASQTDENFTSALKTKLDGLSSSGGSTTDEEIQDVVGGMLSGNTETGIAVTYDDSDGTIDFAVASQTDENFTSADHTKLDGIETGATADQTDEEIQDVVGGMLTGNTESGISATYDDTNGKINLSVSSQTDENFTSALKTKLDGITGSGGTISTEDVQDAIGSMLVGNSESGISVTYDDSDGTIDFAVDSQTEQDFTSALKTKLDGIEESATADQTNAEIRAAVEAATDSNVFTNADHTKLEDIEEEATADQTASEIRTLVESATDSNVFTDADHDKLDDLDRVSRFVPRSISFSNTSSYIKAYGVTDGFVDHTITNVGTGDFSIVFYARLDAGGTQPVLTKLSGTGYRLRFTTGGKLILTMQDSGGSAAFELTSGLDDGKWHTYVVTVDRSGNAIAYVDNVAQANSSGSVGVDVSGTAGDLDSTGEFRIGSDGGSNSADGIALGNYVAVYDAILGSEEISAIHQSADTVKDVSPDALLIADLRRADQLFSDLSTGNHTVLSAGTIVYNDPRITTLENVAIGNSYPADITASALVAADSFVGLSVVGESDIGYGYAGSLGRGGTVTQLTSKGTSVELDKPCGEIVMHGAELLTDATVNFTLDNNTIQAGCVVIVNVASVGGEGAYQVSVGAIGSGSCSITVTNVGGSDRSEAIKLNFAVITAVSS